MKVYLKYGDQAGNVWDSKEYNKKDLRFYYHTFIGRFFLWIMTRRFISKATGWYMTRRMSCMHIKGFIKKNNIDMSIYEDTKYKCYNDFFTRKRKSIHFDDNPSSLISPCDSKLTYYKITDDLKFEVKQSVYSIETILKNKELADKYKNGTCLVFRLTVSDYHRYAYIDNGTKDKNVFIKGILHTVQPIAVESRPVYHQNCREYTILHTENFGDVIQMEVGAMCVGKICNYQNEGSYSRGEEKGKFLFGGSTIILLLKEGTANINEGIIKNSEANVETVVKIGENIGYKA